MLAVLDRGGLRALAAALIAAGTAHSLGGDTGEEQLISVLIPKDDASDLYEIVPPGSTPDGSRRTFAPLPTETVSRRMDVRRWHPP